MSERNSSRLVWLSPEPFTPGDTNICDNNCNTIYDADDFFTDLDHFAAGRT